MGIVFSVVILILTIVIQAFLQLTPGIFTLFYHYRLGKTTAKKTDNLSLSFILGTEIFTAVFWFACFLILTSIIVVFPNFTSGAFWWVFAGIFGATAFASFFFYYRKPKTKSTILFIPRRIAKNYLTHTKTATSRQQALSLGFYVNLPELIFTFPLYFVSAAILTTSPVLPRSPFIIAYVIISIVPLFIIRTLYRSGLNLANIQRLRIQFKPFVRLFIPFCYILLAIAAINLGVL